MDKRAAWLLGIVFGGLFLCLFAFLFILFMAVNHESEESFGARGGDRIGVVEVTGTITDSKRTLKELKDFAEESRIKAIVLRIDSPGGSVGPSQEIYDAVLKLREKKKVVASMGSIAASGGFYIASAANKIYANPGTLTGSIGVIFELPNVRELLGKVGVQMNVVKAGALKDSGSPFRDMTPEEKTYFESMLQDVHAQFIDAVAKGRGLTAQDVRPYADGRVFTGRQAKEYKLVDELGGLEDAVAEASKLAGEKKPLEPEYPKKKSRFLEQLLGDDAETRAEESAARIFQRVLGNGLQYRMPL